MQEKPKIGLLCNAAPCRSMQADFKYFSVAQLINLAMVQLQCDYVTRRTKFHCARRYYSTFNSLSDTFAWHCILYIHTLWDPHLR